MSRHEKGYDISAHKDEIITDVIKKLAWVPIAAVIPVVWELVKFISKNVVEKTIFSVTNLLAVALIAEILGSIWIVVHYKRKYRVVPLTDFRIESIIAEMQIKSREAFVSTLHYDLVPNKDGLKSFKKSILWTGGKYNGTSLTSANGPYTFNDLGGNDGYHTYEVKFNESIKCQDPIRFVLETSVSDVGHQMQPIYGYSVKHQIDRLVLRVVAPPNVIHDVEKYACWDMGRLMKVGEKEIVTKERVGGNEVYEVEIQNPTLLCKFFLEWEFTT